MLKERGYAYDYESDIELDPFDSDAGAGPGAYPTGNEYRETYLLRIAKTLQKIGAAAKVRVEFCVGARVTDVGRARDGSGFHIMYQ